MYCINICPLINSCQIRTQNQDQTKLMKHLIIQTEKEYLEGRVIKEVGHFTYCESYISQFSCVPLQDVATNPSLCWLFALFLNVQKIAMTFWTGRQGLHRWKKKIKPQKAICCCCFFFPAGQIHTRIANSSWNLEKYRNKKKYWELQLS